MITTTNLVAEKNDAANGIARRGQDWRTMEGIDTASLAAAGCDKALAMQLAQLAQKGDTMECLRLLRKHRCDLVDAMHKAQMPIDVCDWIIRKVEKSHA